MKVFNLNLNIAKEALMSKEALEALAFCVMVKATFQDSVIRNATIRRCKSIFHIGTTKISRIIKNGIQLGYLRREGDNIVACKINERNAYSVKLKFEYSIYDDEKGCLLNIKDVESLIRQSYLANHIKKMNSTSDTLQMTLCPTNTKELKKSKARVTRMLKGATHKICDYVSNKRLAKVVNTSLYQVRKCIGQLVSKDIIECSYRAIKTNIDPKKFCEGLVRFYQENACSGYLFRSLVDGNIYLGGARVFRYKSDIIFFAK